MTVDYQLPYSSIYSNNHTLTVFPTDYFQTNAETNPPKLKTPLIMGNICLCHLPRSDLLRTEILSLLPIFLSFLSPLTSIRHALWTKGSLRLSHSLQLVNVTQVKSTRNTTVIDNVGC